MHREPVDWLPRGPRRPTERAAEARWPGGSAATVVVSNVSYEGCQLTSTHAFVRGETVELELPGLGEMRAQVRWVRGGKAGVKFLTGDSARDARRARIGV